MEFELLVELGHLLLVFLARGHSITCTEQPFVFTKYDGQPMSQVAHLSVYWGKLLTLMECPSQFGPHM